MKVGIVCYPSLGGSGIVATELGHMLAKLGHEVHFITYEVPFRLQLNHPNVYFHEVSIQQYDLFKYPDYALTLSVKMAEVAKEYQLDLFHVHYAIPHATSAFLAKKLLGKSSPKVITTLHGTDITLVGKDPSFFQIVKFSIEQSDAVTCVSHSLKKQTMTSFQIDKPIEVIYNFFTPKKGGEDTKQLKQKLCPFGEKLLLHASNFRPVKRVFDVIDIFKKVKEKLSTKLLFLGTGKGIEKAKSMVKDLHLEEDVIFVGKNRYVEPYFSASDLLLFPSQQESFGMVALEAMAYGIPVIASDVGGLPEVISHEKTGYLCRVGDTDKMAFHCLDILSDEKRYKKMSSQAQHVAKTRFCADKIVSQYEKLYQKILEK